LALRLIMRRIAATLAVVVALMFSAGSAWADFDDGVAAAQRGDFATAIQEWRPLAEQGHAKAQTNLGVMYLRGTGVPANAAKAYMWISLSKAQGYKNAAVGLDAVKEVDPRRHIQSPSPRRRVVGRTQQLTPRRPHRPFKRLLTVRHHPPTHHLGRVFIEAQPLGYPR